jgi:hypothetical protein
MRHGGTVPWSVQNLCSNSCEWKVSRSDPLIRGILVNRLKTDSSHVETNENKSSAFWASNHSSLTVQNDSHYSIVNSAVCSWEQ